MSRRIAGLDADGKIAIHGVVVDELISGYDDTNETFICTENSPPSARC